jgi:hypothetical protein
MLYTSKATTKRIVFERYVHKYMHTTHMYVLLLHTLWPQTFELGKRVYIVMSNCKLYILFQNVEKWLKMSIFRVARWYFFKPKILIWVNFGESSNGIFWYILLTRNLFYGHFIYFVAIWCILWLFGILFPVLECCTKKNLATLVVRWPHRPCCKLSLVR